MRTNYLTIGILFLALAVTTGCKQKSNDTKKVGTLEVEKVDLKKVKDDIVEIIVSLPDSYETVKLSTGEKLPLAYKKENVPPGWDEIYSIGPFSFSKRAFEFAGKIIDEIIEKNINPVFIDEIGPLELQGKGFCPMLEKILKTQKDVYIVVRSHCVDEVAKRFEIKTYEIIKI